MTRVYPDTSVLVSAHTEEAGSIIAEDWLTSVRPGELLTSPWCETEIASALAAKARAGNILHDEHRRLSTIIGNMLKGRERDTGSCRATPFHVGC